MDSIEKSSEGAEEDIETLRREILNIKQQEANGELSTEHLTRVNPDELTPADLRFWRLVRDGNITHELAEAYNQSVSTEVKGNPSRSGFVAFINNKATSIFLKRELEALRSEQK